ncbi:MAG TPA: hypothetical protein VNN77_07890 [candidate division Zixibacteria bacterium]|nr:hypothetical protein [candidate division Zixibacteria bacterium]
MPYKDVEADDPMELVGVVLPAAAETMEEMAYAFAEEFALMGYDADRLLRLFQNPFYAGAHQAYRALGDAAIRGIVRECTSAWARAAVKVQEVRDDGNGSNGVNVAQQEKGHG